MTNKKIAHPKRAPKRTTKTPSRKGSTFAEILAERGVSVPDAGDDGADEAATIADLVEGPLPEGLIAKAAERAGVSIPPPITPEVQAEMDAEDRARDKLVAGIGPRLVLACDQLGEELARYREPPVGGEFQNVLDALYSIWSIRWDLGMTPKLAAKQTDETEGTEPAKVAS